MKTGWAWVLLTITLGHTSAQGQGIYTCVDHLGRKLTSDRPIPECIDREQKILNPSGSVKSVLAPPKSAKELADLEAKKKMEKETQARVEEDKKRDRALIGRYPNQAAHDKVRAEALAEVGQAHEQALSQVKELTTQRDKIAAELEFYAKEPNKAPPALRRRNEENDRKLSEQRQLMLQQDKERVRVSSRFDEELARLKPIWAQKAAPAVTAADKAR